MALYSDKVMDHFKNPRNVGEIPDADGVGEVGNAKCGDIMKMYIQVEDGVITDVDFDAKDANGNLKSEATAETYPMDPLPSEWIPQLEENVKAAGTADKIEAVAGATSSSESVKVLMAAVEKQAKAGNTEVVLVDNAE